MVRIGTHDGKFHCDEALAVHLLRLLPEYRQAEVVRTRDPALLATCDVVCDVGGVFDPASHRYDHHQRDFTESMNSLDSACPWTTKLSSAGLVYAHFGRRVVATLLEQQEREPLVERIYRKVYEGVIEEIDAVDNGISPTDQEPRYKVNSTIGCRVSDLNPSWNEKDVDVTSRFYEASALVGRLFEDRVRFYARSWWPARELVAAAVAARHEVHAGGEVMVLAQGGCPWKEHLFELEEELDIQGQIKFVLYEDRGWRVQCVPRALTGFDNRLSLLEAWRGLRDEELSKAAGVPGCVFVHASGFIGGAATRDAALELALKTLAARPTGAC